MQSELPVLYGWNPEWTGDRLHRTRRQAIADGREYVAVYYNSQRLHSTLDYNTPLNYEKDLNEVSGNSWPLQGFESME